MPTLRIAALLFFLHAGSAFAADPAIPLGLPDEALLRGLGPLSCRADLPAASPLKNTHCSRAELIDHGMTQQILAVALTVLAEVYPGDWEAVKLVLITIFTRRWMVSSPGAEVTLTDIISQRKQYAGWSTGRLNPATIAQYLMPTMQMAAAFARGELDSEPLRFTNFTRCDSNVSWLTAARKAGIVILETADGHCWVTGTEDRPAMFLPPRPKGAKKGVSWRRVRDSAPAMFAAIYGPRGRAAGVAMR
jgi:hypothetical protein